jgi:hypothetical protein
MQVFLRILCLAWFISAANAAKLSGVVTDPSGAAIEGAAVQAKGVVTVQTSTDDQGRFLLDKLAGGEWSISAERAGFIGDTQVLNIKADESKELRFELKIAIQQTSIEVTGKRSALANSDSNYRALRDGTVSESYRLENVELNRDVGVFTFRDGQIAFLPPVLNHVTTAAFTGNGRFQMKPAVRIEQQYLHRISGNESVDEEFTSAVLFFTDDTDQEIRKQLSKPATDAAAANSLKDLRHRLRRRQDSPRTLLESFLTGEHILNNDAELLTELYNPRQGGSFRAYLHGKHYSDLRFLVIPQGAMPMLPSPEEVALLNVDSNGERDGIWYLWHRQEETANGKINNSENKRSVLAKHYCVETTISHSGHLTSITDVQFQAVIDGVRVVHFGLLPALRVTRVTAANREVSFIQEDRKEDGSFYVILPEALAAGKSTELHIEYEGSKVIQDEGGGNFAVGARTSWYPSLNSFLDRATYDLVFKVPKQFTAVSVGRLVKEWKESDYAISEWKSEVPIAVAGFNYGLFKEKHITDSETKYDVEAYATQEVPAYLRHSTEMASFTPSAMANQAVVDAQNSMRVFEHWFGPCPYGRIAITQQPQFNFGQSWPTLVYLPVSAFLDSTQRYLLLQHISTSMNNFIEEVTPHEVAHQWWGHMVGWASYRDQWLSEGFAEFSAGVFLELSSKNHQIDNNFWTRLHERMLNKNAYGVSANDAGPIWMGFRLNTFKSPGAYNNLIYPKGAFILHMIRMLMQDDKTGDRDFIAMMHDFVATNLHQNATSEAFRVAVEKHMKPALDLEGNQKFDWFYREWVYGNEIPKYRLEYSLAPSAGGKVTFTGKLTQSDVSPSFVMSVPIYFDFDGRLVRAGVMPIRGNMTSKEFRIELPKKPKRVLLNANHDVLAAESIVKDM